MSFRTMFSFLHDLIPDDLSSLEIACLSVMISPDVESYFRSLPINTPT